MCDNRFLSSPTLSVVLVIHIDIRQIKAAAAAARKRLKKRLSKSRVFKKLCCCLFSEDRSSK